MQNEKEKEKEIEDHGDRVLKKMNQLIKDKQQAVAIMIKRADLEMLGLLLARAYSMGCQEILKGELAALRETKRKRENAAQLTT